MQYRGVGAAMIVLAFLSVSVLAADGKWDQAYTNLTGSDVGQIVNWLQREGYITSYDRFTDGDGDPAFRLIGRDFRCVVYMYAETTDSRGATAYESLTLYAGFVMSRSPSLTTINDWNRLKRLSRAYLKDDGTAVIEFDLDLDGGVTQDAIKEWFIFFLETSVPKFMDHIGW